MTSIIQNNERVGRFTSSEVYKLLATDKAGTGFGAPALTYIKEKQWEKKLGRSLSVEKNSRAILWGKFMESRVHNLLDIHYKLLSDVSIPHPVYGDIWAGSCDGKNEKEDVSLDIKCYEPKAFCEYVDNLVLAQQSGDLTKLKKENAKEWWQLVSHSCIQETKFVEAIVYMPYESELMEIKEMVDNMDSSEQWRYRFISDCAEFNKSELPYLLDGGVYKNLNIFRFEVPQSDKDLLTQKVIAAGKFLI